MPLAPKAFELLLFLVQNQGRLLSKEQIMATLWPGSFVEEANLTVSISVLRKVLGEKEGYLRYIETIPKKGYRFIASVREVHRTSAILLEEGSFSESRNEPVWPGPAANTIPREAKRWWQRSRCSSRHLFGPSDLATAPPPVGHPHFRDSRFSCRCGNLFHSSQAGGFTRAGGLTSAPCRSGPAQPRHSSASQSPGQYPQDDFLGFSLADAVITGLGPIRSLTVRPSSAIERYKGQMIDLQKIGADLSVDTLLTGTFIHDGDHLRITYQLIDVKTEKILGRGTIDRKYENLFTVQDEVTQQIIKGISFGSLLFRDSTDEWRERQSNP